MSKPNQAYCRNSHAGALIVDTLSMLFGVLLASSLMGMQPFVNGLPSGHVFITLIYVVSTLIIFSGFEMYSVVLFRFKETLVTVFLSCIYSMLITFVIYPVVFRNHENMMFIALVAAMSFMLLLFWRESLFFYYLCKRDKPRLLIIEKVKTDNSRIRRMKYACLDKFQSWYEQVDVDDLEVVKEFIIREFPKYDAICLMENVPPETRALIQNAIVGMGKEFYVVPTMYELSFSHMRLTLFDDVMVFNISPYDIGKTARAIKRFMDLLFSGIGLVLAFIPMALIAMAIKLTSPGPVFYKQERLTRGKRSFYIYKFRTMVPDAEKLSGPTLATKDDPRITKIGRLLRATRLDELPQIINILIGDMSIVGPRPERPFFVEQYSKEIPNYDTRFMVKAGLTSLSHVYGRYATCIEDRTLYDLLYMRQFSILLDVRIILLTSRIVFLSEASEGKTTDPAASTNSGAAM